MFITALSIIASHELPKCPTMMDRYRRYIHTMEHYSAINRKEVLGTCNNRDDPQKHYAERSHSPRPTYTSKVIPST